jgi:hypothetical protein
MNPIEAEQIVKNYGAALAQGSEGEIARKLSWLPCSVCKIRQAFYVYLAELISHKALTQQMGNNLKFTYHGLNSFIADADADKINALHIQARQQSSGKKGNFDQKLYDQFLHRKMRMDEMFEINSFINECYGQRDNQDFILT